MSRESAAFADRLRKRLWIVVPAWFIAIAAIRLSVLLPTLPGYDGMLYREATLRWLAGGDPWTTPTGGAVFGAPPPTLLAMLPFAALPEPIARITLVLLAILASIWLIRRLNLPMWWLAFPPLVDGVYIANPQVFVVPLLVAGAAPVAILFKVYAGVVPVLRLEVRALVVTVAVVAMTAPFLPWGLFLERWPAVSQALAVQSNNGGLSVLATPLLLPVALVAAGFLRRERLAWWAVPVFWPFTQWYYASMALPAITPVAAIALACPVPGATTVAIVATAIEHRRRRTPGSKLGETAEAVASAREFETPVLSSRGDNPSSRQGAGLSGHN